MSQVSGAHTLVLLVVLIVTTVWFTNIILKSLDILYKPKVNQWIRKKPGLTGSEFCPLNQPSCDQAETVSSFTDQDELAIKQLEEELMVLKALRGYSRPSRKAAASANLGEDLPELASIKKPPRFHSNYEDAITDSSPDLVQEDKDSQRLLDTLDYCTMNPYSNEKEQCGPNLNVVSSNYEEDALDSLSPRTSRSFVVEEEEESDFETGHDKRCRKESLWKDVIKLFRPFKKGGASHYGVCPLQT